MILRKGSIRRYSALVSPGEVDPGYNPPAFFSNQIAHYPLNETSGDALDLINGYDGTVVSASRDGVKYSFDGNGDYVAINQAVPDMKIQSGSISFYVTLPDSTPNGVNYTLFSVGDASWDTYLNIEINQFLGNRVRAAMVNSFSGRWTLDTSPGVGLSDGVESMVTLVHNGTSASIYLNGTFATGAFTNSTDKTFWLDDSTEFDVATIGALNKNNGITNYTSGSIRDLRIFNKALSESEVLELYNYGPYDPALPTLSNFTVYSEFPNRIYFNSSKVITGNVYTGLSLSGTNKVITGIVINAGQTTNHYFSLNGNIIDSETVTISGTGADNIRDIQGNDLAAFGSTSVAWQVGTPFPADFIYTTITVGDGEANAFVRIPKNPQSPPTGGWPVMVFLGGDGSDVSTTVVTNLPMTASGDNLTYFVSSSVPQNRRMSKSVRIKVNGEVQGYGQFGGGITGSAISTGTMGNVGSSATGAFSVTFTSSQAGNNVTLDYVYSEMLYEGAPLYVNLGDTLDDSMIFIAIQNAQGDTNHNSDYVHNSIKWAYNNYDINIKRLYTSGLSRGGVSLANAGIFEDLYKFYIDDATGDVYLSPAAGRTETGIAATSWATADYTPTYTNSGSYNMAIALVHGADDQTVTEETNLFQNLWGTLTTKNYPFYYVPTTVGHSATLWHTNFYNRKYRTDAAGAAPWDWIDFARRYSYDDLESAELAMQQAEKRRYGTWRDINDWRFAALKISQLGASAEKTALEARLSTLRTAIGGVFYTIVHSTGSVSNSPYYDVNVMTNHADNQSITNLVDIDGTTHSGTSFGIGDNPRTGTYQDVIPNTAGVNNAGNFPVEYNLAGAVINLTGGGSLPIETSGFESGTYAIRVYVMSRTATDVGATINGVTKNIGSKQNSLIGYVEFDGLSPAQFANYTVNFVDAAGIAYFMTITEIIKYA
jgi:hypothetical protein